MRPGYPILLEWGWTPYIGNDGLIYNDSLLYIDTFEKNREVKKLAIAFKSIYSAMHNL